MMVKVLCALQRFRAALSGSDNLLDIGAPRSLFCGNRGPVAGRRANLPRLIRTVRGVHIKRTTEEMR
ncbi:protein of unknown function [Paraburkholderia kururiensis]